MTQEEQLRGSGARFRLKYLGNVAVECGMRDLQEETERDRIVQECIYMVCSHPDLKLVTERPADEQARNLIGNGPLKIANKTIDLVITATALTLVDGDPTSPTANQMLNKQMITNVSIATPGRGDLDGYIAYMVKLKGVDRRCMVYEANAATATAILALIKKAFSIINKSNGEPLLESPSTSQPPAPLGTTSRPSIGADYVARGLDKEPWFHGVLSRDTAEKKLLQDGDYLVRQSENAPGQYVLSGIQGSQARHILLIDDGKVRTRDQEFESIISLICFHRDRKIPITSEDSALTLNRPIPRSLH
ncbi:hypothetical protein L596_029592 [Steinernema carpocapsae]|uniref:SH2 domain-containing protein n=1 Tax=Steinernema carpocapsae TaxID=34508 RepID=A0A4U5LV33_STECR|nr:hypothetical protein L596_029592 [Steinernema carpocapsae]